MSSWTDVFAYRYLAGLLINPWRSPRAIKKLQERKLRKLVEHAYGNVPYYRALLDSARIKPRDIRTLEDLEHIPLTTKAQLRDVPDSEKTARNIDLARCRSFSTSGTTGIPLLSYFTRRDALIKNLAWIRSFVHCGVNPLHKTAVFVANKEVATGHSWYEYLGLWRRREISTWESPESWVRTLRQWRPQIYQGYVMTLRLLAEYVQENNLRDVRPRLILDSSAILEGSDRRFLESQMNCSLIDFYGSDEGGCLAWECSTCQGYHINSDTAILEIWNDGRLARPGEDGEVVITNLHSWAMPFIRYRQDDVVTRSRQKPVCGRRFPLLEEIQGRRDDFILLKSGKKLSPHVFYYSMDFVPGIKRWRITQESAERLKVEIVPTAALGPASLKAIESDLRRVVNDELTVEIVLAEAIKMERGSKFRAVSSKLGGSGS